MPERANEGDKMKTVIGIENEFEGNQTLWLDLANPEMLAAYIKHNLERGDKYVIEVKEMSEEEFGALELEN
jgi:hypothetical protein